MNKKNAPTQTNSRPTPTAKDAAWAWLKNGCCWFTLLCIGLLLLNVTVWNTNGIPPVRFLLLLPLSLCLSAADTVRRSTMSRGARYALHPLLTVGGIYLFGFLPYHIQSNARASTALVMILLILAVYGIAVGLGALILRQKAVKQDDTLPYRSQFKNDRD